MNLKEEQIVPHRIESRLSERQRNWDDNARQRNHHKAGVKEIFMLILITYLGAVSQRHVTDSRRLIRRQSHRAASDLSTALMRRRRKGKKRFNERRTKAPRLCCWMWEKQNIRAPQTRRSLWIQTDWWQYSDVCAISELLCGGLRCLYLFSVNLKLLEVESLKQTETNTK